MVPQMEQGICPSRIEQAEVGEDLGAGADHGAGVALPDNGLPHSDGGADPGDLVERVLAGHVADHANRLQVLLASLLKDDVEREAGLARAADGGDDDEHVLGEVTSMCFRLWRRAPWMVMSLKLAPSPTSHPIDQPVHRG